MTLDVLGRLELPTNKLTVCRSTIGLQNHVLSKYRQVY